MSNARTAYGLYAEGQSVNGWIFRKFYKGIFARREEAETAMADFRDKCMSKDYFDYVEDGDSLKMKIIEFDLYD